MKVKFRERAEANEMEYKRETEEKQGGKCKEKVYQAESWTAREERLWLEVTVRLEGATRSILEVSFLITLEVALLTWLEVRGEVLTDMMTSSN